MSSERDYIIVHYNSEFKPNKASHIQFYIIEDRHK